MRSLLNALQDGRLIELPDTDKERSLRYLAHLIEAVPDLAPAESAELTEAMLARERRQNTGLGLGVACPHVRAAGAGEMLCAVGWSPAGIDYGASDGKKVHLVAMYYIPDTQKNVYLKEVSALAGAITKQGGIQPIAQAQDLATVRERLLDWVSSAIDAALPEARARMIRLEARQAAAEAKPLAPGTLRIVPVLILACGTGRPVVLCQYRELAASLERDEELGARLKSQGQFDREGYRLVLRSATAYDQDRTLYDYLAVKVS
ncbi:MAG: PTS sugar transporter subunit IIA [Elusimicrobia bacterium]|nr:PTS sugar transporter subunit IIA [Elusimicrobiota bacterium]